MDGIELQNQLLFSRESGEVINAFYKKTIDRPENYAMHLNEMCEVYVFIAGNADYVVENRCFGLKPLDVVIISPYEPHMPLLKTADWYERFYFLLPVGAFSFMELDPIAKLLDRTREHNNLISLPPEKKKRLGELLSVFKTEDIRHHVARSLAAESALFGILGLLNEHIESVPTSRRPEDAENIPPLIFDVMRYVDRHLDADCTEEEIAAAFHISVPYLSRLFKASMKMGLKKYILMRKIGNAKKMLDSGKTVTETCFASGFNDCSYFIKVFRNYTGLTPYKYQNSGRE